MNKESSVSRILPFVNIAAFLLVIVMNFLSNALPLNGRTAGEISDALPSFFTPAGYTFSIWGVIYLGLLAFTVYQALPAQRDEPWLRKIGWLFAASSAANTGWLLAWHYGYYLLSIVLMVTLLATLMAIALRLRLGKPDSDLSMVERLLVHVPFSLYLGWITVATIANIASVAAHLGWEGFGIAGPTWSAIMMLVAVVVAGLFLYNRRNLAYAGVLIWALFGIRAAQEETIITMTALVAAILIAILALVGYLRTSSPETAGVGEAVAT